MSFNQYIDHTILKAETKKEDVLRIIKEAKENHFCSVCINPTWVSLAAKELADSDVKVCTVIGFPLGAIMGRMKWIWLLILGLCAMAMKNLS